jgi:hypothetical protein
MGYILVNFYYYKWNLWYPPWYLVPTTLTPNVPTPRKSLPYPIYTRNTDFDICLRVFQKAIQANGEKHDLNMVKFFLVLHFEIRSQSGARISCSHTQDVPSKSLKLLHVNIIKKFKMMNMCILCCS